MVFYLAIVVILLWASRRRIIDIFVAISATTTMTMWLKNMATSIASPINRGMTHLFCLTRSTVTFMMPKETFAKHTGIVIQAGSRLETGFMASKCGSKGLANYLYQNLLVLKLYGIIAILIIIQL